MATKSSTSGGNQVSSGVIAVAVVVLVLFIGWLAYHNFVPPKPPVIPDTVDSPIANWIRAKARESGGDISKLTPEDVQKLQMATQGKGAAYLKRYAHSTQ